MVSITSSLFVWTYDQVVLLAATLDAAAWMIRSADLGYRYGTPRGLSGDSRMPFALEILAGRRTLVFLVGDGAVDQLLALVLAAKRISLPTYCCTILILATFCSPQQVGRQ
jgi:hypothetical protein